MATGFGVGPDANGNGTTPDDIQRITSAEYIWPGIINRCKVTGTTGMSYYIEGGAAVIQVGAVAKVKVPVFEQTVPTQPAPTTGSRTDIVYVKQNFAATDGNNNVIVAVGQTLPANSLELARFTVNAGITSTKQAVAIGNPIYTRPVGASFGVLFRAVDQGNGVNGVLTKHTRGVGSFNLWTDSDVEIQISSCVSGPFANDNTGSVIYKVYVDDKIVAAFERAFNRYWETKQFSTMVTLPVGRHTVKYTVEGQAAEPGQTGQWQIRYGGEDKFPGDVITVIHRGVATS